ncbi:MAG: flavodoxin-dependent (E)-4-hydroxy-3-methylbut-2-enyl-diphosphate synthase [Eubacteriales bacterium]|nr:flavodoxin-dependent (E)-4-hydroxy-3-methylbut-2-enyl-diphosphate synthase [Eubacteriales bacterium]
MQISFPEFPMPPRRHTRRVRMTRYDLEFSSDAAISIQSMNNCPASDIEANLDQLARLKAAGCDLSRIAVPDRASLSSLERIVARSPLPLVADIHFDANLALGALEAGCPKIRINPGNIRLDKLEEIAKKAKSCGAVIRVGVNSGSIRPALRREYGAFSAIALARTGLEAAERLEFAGFDQIVLSLKSSDPWTCIQAYRYVADHCDYPLHLGVTEAGTVNEGLARSAVGIGCLLSEGIGDTVRVSLTADPVEEIRAAKAILKSLHLRQGVELVSCPTCGRTEVKLSELAGRIEARLSELDLNIRVAVMGCRVNGPGEARDCDLGIAGGQGEYLLFLRGEVVSKVPEAEAEDALFRLIDEHFRKEA